METHLLGPAPQFEKDWIIWSFHHRCLTHKKKPVATHRLYQTDSLWTTALYKRKTKKARIWTFKMVGGTEFLDVLRLYDR